jgi:hypothetical protein
MIMVKGRGDYPMPPPLSPLAPYGNLKPFGLAIRTWFAKTSIASV